MCKLERILISQVWINEFHAYQLQALPCIAYYNNVFLLDLKDRIIKNHPFHFDNMCLSHLELEGKIK